MKVLLTSAQSSVLTDSNGLASTTPSMRGTNRPLEAEITASVSTSAALQFEWQVLPPLAQEGGDGGSSPVVGGSPGTAARNPITETTGLPCGVRNPLCGRNGAGSGGKFPPGYRRDDP